MPSGDTLTLALSHRERESYGELVLSQRLRNALARLNPDLPTEALEDAFRKLTRPEGADLIQRNRALHRMLVNGVTVEYRDANGAIRGAQAQVIDFDLEVGAGLSWWAADVLSCACARRAHHTL